MTRVRAELSDLGDLKCLKRTNSLVRQVRWVSSGIVRECASERERESELPDSRF